MNHFPMTDWRKPKYPEKTFDGELKKIPHTKLKTQTPTETRTHTLVLVAG